MCIRDRCHTNHDQQAGTAQLDAHTGQVAQNDRQYSHRSQEDGTHEAVSYTHLDVYKRQIQLFDGHLQSLLLIVVGLLHHDLLSLIHI